MSVLRTLPGIHQLMLLVLIGCSSVGVASDYDSDSSPESVGEYSVDPNSSPEDATVPKAKKQRFWQEWNENIVKLIRLDKKVPDPWEPLNRKIFAFNETADRYVLRPAARAYQTITPDSVELGIGNIFSNLLEVNTILNGLLQFKFHQAASDTGRFLLNSTVGLVGVFDVASPLGLEKHQEDFGQTLGVWGFNTGPYIVVPLLGSYNVRDGFGAMVDVYGDYIGYLDHIPTRNQLWLTRVIDRRAGLLSAEELISGDRYTFIRDAYLQRRDFLVKDGAIEDTFGDEDFDGEWEDLDWEE